MITFILRFLKGLIVGWIVSLMMYLAKRMLAKAFGVNIPKQQNQRHNSRPNGYGAQQSSQGTSYNTYSRSTANQNTLDVVETLWVGMSVDQLRSSFGVPLNKGHVAGGEIWTYANLNGQGVQTSVTIQNSKVISWQDIRTQPANPFAAPSP